VPKKSEVANTMRRPSGDQAGDPCPPTGWPARVSGRGWPPATSTTQIVDGRFAARADGPMSGEVFDWNVRRRPSGDHAGLAPKVVTWRAARVAAGGGDQPDAAVAHGVECDLAAVGRPGGVDVLVAAGRQRLLAAGAVDRGGVDLPRARTVGREGDAAAVGRERGVDVEAGGGRQLPGVERDGCRAGGVASEPEDRGEEGGAGGQQHGHADPDTGRTPCGVDSDRTPALS
jgi:hypothetical protein